MYSEQNKRGKIDLCHATKRVKSNTTVRNSRIFRDPFVLFEEKKKEEKQRKKERLTLAESLSYRRLSERGKRRSAATVRKKESSRRQPAKNSNVRIFPGNKFPSFPAARTAEQIHRAKLTQRAVQLESLAHCRWINGNDCCDTRKRMKVVTLRTRDVHLLVFAIGNECVSLCEVK